MREIVLDTETTGLDALRGDRLVEIGCLELLNHIPSGQTFHVYLNPERDMPAEAFAVHGLSSEFLRDKPLFASVADAFLDFVADSPLVIHNAQFDIGFINAELERAGRIPIARDRLVDTLVLARRRFPAGPNNLDALCSRFGIDNSKRTKHGALLDAELLADIYVELTGGRQANLGLSEARRVSERRTTQVVVPLTRPTPLAPRLDDEARQFHASFVAEMGEKAIWYDYLPKQNPSA
ncbi:MAG: DNA polymerase III subunit epsilon [Alphaproteobacteria bacterium]